MRKIILLPAISFVIAAAFGTASCSSRGEDSPRSETLLEKGWKFHRGEVSEGEESAMIEAGKVPDAALADFDDSEWKSVSVPHDWAIRGPFGKENDLQNVAVSQNFETDASLKTGRTGGLPYVGVGWYRRSFEVPAGKRAELVFDGAMSEARVWVNGREVCFWPYGYTTFHCDVTDFVTEGENTLAVRLENRPNSSRWYPGAGLYRNVHLILTEDVHVPLWGTRIVTESVSRGEEDCTAVVSVETLVENAGGRDVELRTEITDGDGAVVASATGPLDDGGFARQEITVGGARLWSPETPNLYRAVTTVLEDGLVKDVYVTRFGIRTIDFSLEDGFTLNGVSRKFRGVCNHHDLGPLGTAVNVAALRHQLLMLKDMGCDAIRTSHNPPAPELVELCDEMGLMMMLEPFDEWDIAKCDNGYHRFFGEWAEKDLVNMLRHYRNDPSVVIWSIGNEVPSQCDEGGRDVAAFLRDICHREDPTRPVTAGMDQAACVLKNGFAKVLDIPGLNYRTFRYIEAHETLPQGLVLGTETASTVSSRGWYEIPALKRYNAADESHQCVSYDLEACSWSNIPDVDFALAEDYDWTLGQFVWTGFDYLGEPSPYDTDAWPNHSSMFGIIDLASIPKDRFWLYRSVWNRQEPTLHILPHWNWGEGFDGNVPVFVYTSWPEAELFVNGVSQGRRRKYNSALTGPESPVGIDTVNVSSYADQTVKTRNGLCGGGVNEPVETRYRLMWYDVPYEPGEVKVVAYDEDGRAVDEALVRTAGEPDHIELVCSYGVPRLKADGKDLAYVTVRVVDRDGNLCPLDDRLMEFKVTGSCRYRAAANGDPTCLDIFHEPRMHAFNGMLTVIVQAGQKRGSSVLEVSAEGLPKARMKFNCL